ncbi:MAG: ATP-dependent Clp protease ATP-binding subunit [Clostridiales bacterium]|jgi:ATP-dependent Clp protease ATP-binding subunit ClpC|nr:ATP-dependent Clp protease ATP-binding subunit [Clostridiales bacterium]
MKKFTYNYNRVMRLAEEKARAMGTGEIGTEHILYGMLKLKESAAAELLQKAGVTLAQIEKFLRSDDWAITGRPAVVNYSPRAKRIIDETVIEFADSGEFIGTEHLLFNLMKNTDCMACRIVKSIGADINRLLRSAYQYILSNSDDLEQQLADELVFENENQIIEFFFGKSPQTGKSDESKADGRKYDKNDAAYAALGTDLTEKARDGKLDPVIGRTKEIERVVQILSRRTKNNPVLIGEPGVGKSAIAEGLAQLIVSGNIPENLKNKRIFSLDISSVVAGTKYRGEFEERLKKAVAALMKNGNMIVFIDEIHMIVGAGSSEGSLDAANILKPLLARGELQTIGATTIAEYRKHIEKDAALERRFQPVMVDPPNVEDTVVILKGLRDKYEAHHKVKITDEAIEAAAVMSDRYITDRFLPDKAIDLIDEAASRIRLKSYSKPSELKGLEDKLDVLNASLSSAVKKQEFERAGELKEERKKLAAEIRQKNERWREELAETKLSIGENEIAEIVSSWTSVPVKKLVEDESEKLMKLEETIKKRIIGQDEAVKSLSRAIRRARAGIKDPKRPIGSFIFLGPTGVGKTELSKAVAEAMFGDENLLVRIDMSEYMEKFNVSKFIGSAPGYVGFEEGGQLTEKIRRKPYSVVLFDEVEKAHPDVFNILLQILEDGVLTDSHGRTVSFKNTIIIMTSNVGATDIKNTLGFGGGAGSDGEYESMKDKQLDALKNTFKPEFINRIDDIIIFRKLSKDDIKKIAAIMIESIAKRLKDRKIGISITDSAIDYLVDKGYDTEYGARNLRRTIQKMIEDKLSEDIITGNYKFGDNVTIDYADGKLNFKKSGADENAAESLNV